MPAAHPLSVRIAIVVSYFACLHYAVEFGLDVFWDAVEVYFICLAPFHRVCDSYFRKFALKWVARFCATGSVQTITQRSPKLPDDIARKLAEKLLAGYTVEVEVEMRVGRKRKRSVVKEQRQLWYRSIREFIARNPDVQQLLQEWNVSPRTLLRRMHAVAKLSRRVLHPRAPLTDEHMRHRKHVCSKLLGMSASTGLDPLIHYLSRVCWIDSKVYYIGPRDCLVYAKAGVDMTHIDRRVTKNKSKQIKVVYYAVVNALLGPVYFEYVTGTSNHEQDPHYKQYKVRLPPSPVRPLFARL
jgi:hypothetical protein